MEKNKFKSKLSELSWAILEIVARSPEAIINGFIDHKSLGKYLRGQEEFLADKLLYKLRHLKKQGYVETDRNGGLTSVKISIKGKIKNIENPLDNRLDGKIRAVSYDIPEVHNNKRKQFCRSLKRIGYIQLQKSLWVCKYCKAEEIDLLIDDLGLNDYVVYFVIEKSNIGQHLKKITQ